MSYSNVIYFFSCRGRENLCNMSLNQFQIGVDPDGRKFVFQAIDEHDKNHGIEDTDPTNQGKMYAQPSK